MRKSSTHTDEQLFKELAKGSSRALNWIYEKYYSSLMAHCVRIIHDEEITKEVVADSFQTLWEKKETVALMNNPIAWLKKCATNKSINAARAIKRRRQVFLSDEMEIPSPEDIETNLYKKEGTRKVDAAINLLPAQQKKIIQLYLHGLSRKEIAVLCSLSESTIKNHITEANNKLRNIMKSMPGDTG